MKEKWGQSRIITDRDQDHPEDYTFSRRVAQSPPEAQFSVAGVDVQHNRVYWMLRAFDRNETSWVIGWGYEYARRDHSAADTQEVRALLTRVDLLLKQYCGETTLVSAGLDIGDNTDVLRDWVDEAKGVWRATKGHTNHMKAVEGDIEGLAYWRDKTLLIQTDAARDMFHTSFRRPLDGQGATHFPFGVGVQDVAVFRHICSEQTGIDPETKKRITVYGVGRNDWLDCGKITQVMMFGYLMEQKQHEKKEQPAARPAKETSHGDDALPPGAGHSIRSPLALNRPTRELKEGGLYRTQRSNGLRRGY
jgi:phage terminase large subunit GpA-like protein